MQGMQLTSTVAGLCGWHRMRQSASGIQGTRPKRKEEAEEVKKKRRSKLDYQRQKKKAQVKIKIPEVYSEA